MSYTFTPSSSRDRTLYAQIITGPRTIQNASGVWTNTGTSKVRFNTFGPSANNPVNSPQYKTGNRSRLQGLRGRQGGSWTLNKPFFPSGAAGTRPDDDTILESIFGATGTVVASTSVTYNLTDALNFLGFFDYNKTPGASSPTNRYVLGAIPQSVKFMGGGNFLDMEISGTSVGVADSVNFASYVGGPDAPLGGTLTTFPAEPTVSTNGNVISGFGSGAGFSIGGSPMAEVRGTVEISMAMGVEAIADALDDQYIIGFVGGLREISIANITCIDSDSTLLNSLKAASLTKAPQVLAFQFGNVAGSIVTINLGNVQIGNMSWEEAGAALNVKFGEAAASSTSSALTNELQVVLT